MFCSVGVAVSHELLPAWMRVSLRAMPNGCIDGWCRYCRVFGALHFRSADDYDKFLGWYCDDCWDWIEADDEHWRLYALMNMADSSRSHPLSGIVSDCGLGHAIADFIRPPPWMGGFP